MCFIAICCNALLYVDSSLLAVPIFMFVDYYSSIITNLLSPNYMNPGYFTLAAIDLKP